MIVSVYNIVQLYLMNLVLLHIVSFNDIGYNTGFTLTLERSMLPFQEDIPETARDSKDPTFSLL